MTKMIFTLDTGTQEFQNIFGTESIDKLANFYGYNEKIVGEDENGESFVDNPETRELFITNYVMNNGIMPVLMKSIEAETRKLALINADKQTATFKKSLKDNILITIE